MGMDGRISYSRNDLEIRSSAIQIANSNKPQKKPETMDHLYRILV